MQLTDWVIILAIALMSVAFFCSRRLRCPSLRDRARRLRGTRLLVQATIAVWAGLVTFDRGLVAPIDAPFGVSVPPHAMLGVALMLMAAGCLWSIRGRRLLRPRRWFHPS